MPLDQLSVEDRLALLEQRLGLATPRALTPPITIGELTNVPAPGSQLAAEWAQDVSSRTVQRFPNIAALKAWVAPVGVHAVDVATGVEWRRTAAGWSQVTPWTTSVAGIATPPGTSTPLGTFTLATANVPADPGPRILTVSALVLVQKFMPAQQVTVRIVVNGGTQAQADIGTEQDQSVLAGELLRRPVALYAGNIAEASPAVVVLQLVSNATRAEIGRAHV